MWCCVVGWWLCSDGCVWLYGDCLGVCVCGDSVVM